MQRTNRPAHVLSAGVVPVVFGTLLAIGCGDDDSSPSDAESAADSSEDSDAADSMPADSGDADSGDSDSSGDDSGDDSDDDGADTGADNGEPHALLTVQGIYNHVIDNDVTNVHDLLGDMPASMRESYVLMEDTRSRHLSDLEHPRLIMYGLDARFMLSAGGVEEDPLYEVIEMAELDSTTGQWIFRQLDFQQDPPALSSNDAACIGCHGDPVRPIWGNYPDWPGAYGANENDLTSGQVTVMLDLLANQDQTARYHHLALPDEHSIANNYSFYLPTRGYGFANTSFNFELVVAQSDGLVTRMSLVEGWDELRYDLVAAYWCGRGDSSDVFAALGLSGPNDFQLHGPVFEAEPGGFGWNQGSTGLDDVVIFRVIDRIAAEDSAMAATLEAAEPTRSEWVRHWFDLRGDARADWLSDFDLYDYDLRPQELLPAVSGDMCRYLESR